MIEEKSGTCWHHTYFLYLFVLEKLKFIENTMGYNILTIPINEWDKRRLIFQEVYLSCESYNNKKSVAWLRD